MDDMNSFERLIAGEVASEMGPSRSVDAAAVFAAAVPAKTHQWRFQSMFSATKLVVAGAIVALFGGFLLSGVLTQPSEEVLPAAVTDSPAPTMSDDLLPGVDLVTEEVEPGVERIVSDGIRDLSVVGGPRGPERDLAITPDGAVWLYTSPPDTDPMIWEDATLVRLGDPDSYAEGVEHWLHLEVSPDGALWTGTEGSSIGRPEGEGWSEMARLPPGVSVDVWDIAADGTVWAGWLDGNVARLDASGWQDHPIDLDSFEIEFRRLVEDHGEDPDAVGLSWPYFVDLAVDANGDVWAALSVTDWANAPMVLLRYDGETWSPVDPLGLGGYITVDLLDVGPDGTMWVYLETASDTVSEDEQHYLARLADDRWTVFSEEDGVVKLVYRSETWGLLRVDQDGAVWVKPQDGRSQGVRVFDGKTWRQYLDGHDVSDMEIAPDGKVWVATYDDLYRITPEAVAAAE